MEMLCLGSWEGVTRIHYFNHEYDEHDDDFYEHDDDIDDGDDFDGGCFHYYQSSIKCGVSSQRNLCHFFGS